MTRFCDSIEEELLESLDIFVLENKYPNHLQELHEMIEKYLVENNMDLIIVKGLIVMKYSHIKNNIAHKLIKLQMQYSDIIFSSLEYYLKSDNRIEIVAVKSVA